jgi:hypothetical protein
MTIPPGRAIVEARGVATGEGAWRPLNRLE